MKKKILGLLTATMMLLAVVGVVSAKVDRVTAWELTAPSGIDFVCGGGHYLHTLNTVTNTAGVLEGAGWYNPDHSYTWNMTGDISDDNINFSILYTGTAAGSVYNASGVIASNGSISGTVDSNCQTFTMAAGSAVRFEGNHGQWVKMSGDKQEAAQSKVGMPVQSNGHTK